MSSPIIQGYRLSPQQKRLWHFQQSDQSPAGIARCLIEIEGELDADRLQRTLDLVVRQHEILRTSFQLLPGMTIPLQVIAEKVAVPLSRTDLSQLSPEEQATQVEALFNETHNQIDYTELPLLRAQLLRLSNSRALMLINAPALCADEPSLHCLFRQIARAYLDARFSLESMQYADFAEWQNELLESIEASAALQHWKQIDLSHNEPRLPFEKRNPSAGALATIKVDLDPRLRDIAETNGIAGRLLLLACWQTLLLRSTGWEGINVAVALAGRKFSELNDAVGPIESYLPISAGRDLMLSDLLRRTSEQLQEAERLQQFFAAEQLAQLTGNTILPPFSFCFSWRELPPEIAGAGLTFRLGRVQGHSEPFRLKLVGEQSAEGVVTASLHYDASLFAGTDVQRLAERFTALTEDIVSDDDKIVSEINVLGSTERHRLLVEFNQTARQFPAQCIHELFADQVQQTPDAVALVFENEQLTFAELNARSNRVAHRLQRLGVGPDARVGLCLERSVNLIAGLLGILKAGGAYVPLDPGLPADRLRGMLTDAAARVLVTRTGVAQELISESLIVLDIEAGLDGESNQNPSTNTSEQNLAYIIFTSGSTGRPKGVGVEHRQLANYVHAISRELDLPAGSSFATVSTIAADLGNTTLFPPLLTGGTLHLIAEETATDPDGLANYCRCHHIDCLKIVPSHLSALLAATNPEDLLPKRKLVLGGEACPRTLAERVGEVAPACQILNHYGPTETTVGATTFAVDLSDEDLSETVPLGSPLPNVQAYVLDQRMQPSPIGVAGELHIGGAGVARGYVGRADATAEKFIPHPFSTVAGERLYRTGDLARYRSDGRIEFLGRSDDQVKIHGFRIEPAEIEQVLRSHPGVREAVVIAREDQPGDKRLAAYVVPRDQTSADLAAIQALLKTKLPEYMIPRALMLLESIPLTRNGKVDRQALPAPESLRPEAGERVAPRNVIEETLANIWSGVLGVSAIGIHDNFFELGGDSILSIQIIARANQAGLKLSPRQVFQHQTIAELAAVAGSVTAPVAELGLVLGPVALTPVQARFFAQEQPEPYHYNQARLLNVDERLDFATLERAFEQLVIHHDALRLRFQRTDDGWQQTLVPPGANPCIVEKFDLAELSERAAAMQASLDLEKGPLVRAGLFTSSASESGKLLIVIHHLAVDGVSWPILLEDLQTLYSELSRGREPELPAKTTSFKRWSEMLTAHGQSDEQLAEAPFWIDLVGATVTQLPIDHELGANTSASAATITVALNARETLALLMEAPAAYRTQINEVLLTALAQTLSQWTKSTSVLLDLEGHGREDLFPGVDLTRTVGWFTSIFPVALDLKEADSVTSALRLVKEQLRLIPNRGIGYGVLRHLSTKPKIIAALRKQPQAEVRFNYLGQTDRLLRVGSLFTPAAESSGPAQSPATDRGYLLNIIGAITGGRLQLEWTYSQNLHKRETIERLAETYLKELRSLIANARSVDAASLSPTDFSSARLSQADLNKVLEKLRR